MMKEEEFLATYGNFFENLNKDVDIGKYKVFFTPQTYFEDPFHKIKGDEKIYAIFQSMYMHFYEPRFEVLEKIASESGVCYLQWRLTYQVRQNAQKDSMVGVSRVVFDTSGKVISHVDYWDASSNVYEKIPLIGAVLRFIKRRINASTKF